MADATPKPPAQGLMWRVKRTKLWKSIFRHDFADTPRTRLQRIFGNVFLHLHPVRIPKDAIRPTYTWGLGGISFYLFLLLTFTGILLMFYYRPTTVHAFRDMKDLAFAVTMGGFTRNLHRWAAHAMVIFVIFHMVRVFLTGAYKPPREYNWAIGVILLVLTLLLSYTGYLLPWDQLALWAVTVGANMAANTPVIGAEGPFAIAGVTNDARFAMLGGTSVGENALLRFYVMHCVAIPFIFLIFVAVHLWRIRKDGFSKTTGEKVDVWPHLVSRELLAALLVTAVLCLWAVWLQAPLEEQANPTLTPNPSKAPWYFVGLQELLVYFDPWIAGVTLPGIIVLGLMALPYVDVNPQGIGEYAFRKRPFAVTVFLIGTAMWFVLIFMGYYCRGTNWEWYWPGQAWSHHRITKLTLKNLPNLWGAVLMLSYFGEGLAVPSWAKERAARRVGPKTVPATQAAYHFGLGLVMAVSLCVPLVGDRALFAALGTAKNAPVMVLLYQLAGGIGAPATMALVLLIFGSVLGWLSWFAMPSKDRLLDQLGPLKYAIVMGLLLLMFGVVGKIVLRLLFGIKYLIAFPGVSLNI